MSNGPASTAIAGWALMVLAALAAAIVSAVVIRLIRPRLLKHALAKPNARSSHRVPTPQGAGIAVIAATLAIAGIALASGPAAHPDFPVVLFGATLFLAALGFADDINPVPVLPRLCCKLSRSAR
jgi:UDP-N-acetylmuramyl pentapeptide phosphotransferase/UDP-N-acetylglucosamine-1-phosphate transferase